MRLAKARIFMAMFYNCWKMTYSIMDTGLPRTAVPTLEECTEEKTPDKARN